MKIGFIGTGVMGSSMVLNLLKADIHVNVNNRTKSKAQTAIENGAIWYDTIEDLTLNSDIIITILGFPSDVEAVYLGSGGILEYAQNKILIDMSTSSPNLAKDINQIAKDTHNLTLDAPVTGGDLGAKNATLAIMVGGEIDAFNQCQYIFDILGKTIVYAGSAGNGQLTKLANQIAIANNVSGMVESLYFAKLNNLDLEKTLKIFSGGSAQSWQIDNMAKRVLDNDFEPGFYIKHFLKDLRLVLDICQNEDIHLEALETVIKMYEKLEAMDLEDKGTQALFLYYL